MEVIFSTAYSILPPTSAGFSLVLIVTIWVQRNNEHILMRKTNLWNIFWMSVSDFGFGLRSCSQFFQNYPPTGSFWCYFNASGGVFFSLAIQSWYFIISFQILMTIWFKTTPQWMKNRILYHIYVWFLCSFITIVTFHTYTNEEHTGTCWIAKNNYYELFIIIPLSIYIFFAILLLLSMCYLVRSVLENPQQKAILIRTTVFVVVFVVTWSPFWWSACLILSDINPPKWMLQYTLISASMSGILNFIVWLFCFPDLCHRCTQCFGKRTVNLEEALIQTSNNSFATDTLSVEIEDWKRDWIIKQPHRTFDEIETFLLDTDQYKLSYSMCSDNT